MDLNLIAKSIVDFATGDVEVKVKKKTNTKKVPVKKKATKK